MSKTPKQHFFTLRCPKCRKRNNFSVIKSHIPIYLDGEHYEKMCPHCSHNFEVRFETKVVAINKKL